MYIHFFNVIQDIGHAIQRYVMEMSLYFQKMNQIIALFLDLNMAAEEIVVSFGTEASYHTEQTSLPRRILKGLTVRAFVNDRSNGKI